MAAFQIFLVAAWSGVFTTFALNFVIPDQAARPALVAGLLASIASATATAMAFGTGIVG